MPSKSIENTEKDGERRERITTRYIKGFQVIYRLPSVFEVYNGFNYYKN